LLDKAGVPFEDHEARRLDFHSLRNDVQHESCSWWSVDGGSNAGDACDGSSAL
jgi:hypothetical protein